MKIYLVCILMVILTIRVNAQNNATQTITGKVYRAGTDSVIASASVYYSNTMQGTVTDAKGNFTLTAKQQPIPIIVSCIGYLSATVNYSSGQPLVIYLKPKLQELREVTVHADGMDRKDEIKLFTQEFLGTSKWATSCTILNMDDISFFFNKKTNTLMASCDKPIVIINKKLGYNINYYLDSFKCKLHGPVAISGNFIFKENFAVSDQLQIKRNRDEVYEGSRMQFIRALWQYNLKKGGFDYFVNGYPSATEHQILAHDSLRQRYIHLPAYMSVVYRNNTNTRSYVTPKTDLVFIDKDGYYGQGLVWDGAMGNQRIGDLLPFEYQSEKDVKNLAETALSTVPLPITKQVEKPTNQLVFEKTYLHTDRDVYAPGDTLWFKAYLVNAQDNTPANSSGNLYVELISPDAKIIGSELIRLDGGLGNGDFDLADTLAPGQYRLRAYTNWMRNFGDNFIFEKEIVLAGSPDVAVAPAVAGKGVAEKKVAAEVAVKNKQRNTANATATKSTATATLPLLRFYPEGGSLVEGISSLVAVKADDGFGKGLPASGVVLSAAGDTICRFSCDSLGMGLFALLPVKGQVYHATVNFEDSAPRQIRHSLNFDLPAALSKGLTLQIKQTDTLIRAVVSTNIDNTASSVKPMFTLIVKHAGVTLLSQQLQLSSQQTSVKIPIKNLPEGIAAITLYDETGKPNAERLVYIHQPKTTEKVSVSTDKPVYQPKEKVTVQISAPANSSLSLAAVYAGIVPGQAEDMVSYLRLQSEVRGNIERARRYFDTTNINRAKQLDLLLMTQGWRDFVWRRLADTAIRISYAAENGVALTGRVEDEVNHRPIPGLNVSLYADAAKNNKIYSYKTDTAGRFMFTGLMLYGKQNSKLASVNDKGEKRGSFLVDTVAPLAVRQNIRRIAVKTTIADSIATLAIANKWALQKVNLKGVTRLKEVKIKGKSASILQSGFVLTTLGYPDQVFNIKPEDEQYKTLEWYLLQKGHGIQKSSMLWHDIIPTGVEIAGIDTGGTGDGPGSAYRLIPPQIFVNGQELNMNENAQAESYRTLYFNMPLNKFKKIVLKHLVGSFHGYSYGGLYQSGHPVDKNGIYDHYLLYLTLIDDYMTDNPGSLSIDVPGYYQARTFYQPPPNAKAQLADYRNTIHWEPNIKTDEAGKATVNFYNAAPPTDVRVVVQGITNSGVPVTSVITYQIK